MVRRIAVALPVVLLVMAFSACQSDSGKGVQVRIASPIATTSPGMAAPPPGPTPTPTTLAEPELLLSATSVYQAGAVLVSITGSVAKGSISFLGRTYPLTQGKQSMYTFVGVDAEDPVGPAPLKADVTLPNGTTGTLSDTVTVVKTNWTVDSLQFTSQQTTDFLDPQVVAAESARLKALYSNVTPEKLWTGPWQLPADGPLTARMGEQRSINGSTPSGHHGGTDIGVPEGTPVHATNRGRVVLAEKLTVRGNMVIIDHGGGLFSGYCHLSEIDVTDGQLVEAGDAIALSGNTGLSTGAHLHWEMAIDGILLDALRFTDGTNGF